MKRRTLLFLPLLALTGCANVKRSSLHADALAVFRYVPEPKGQNVWLMPVEIFGQIAKRGYFEGDCEDFATYCLARTPGARYVLCLTETQQAHVVAEVDGLIHCCRQPHPMRREDLPYIWIRYATFGGSKCPEQSPCHS